MNVKFIYIFILVVWSIATFSNFILLVLEKDKKVAKARRSALYGSIACVGLSIYLLTL